MTSTIHFDEAGNLTAEEYTSMMSSLSFIQSEAARKARNKRRNFRKKAAKYMKTRGIETFAGCHLMPRMRQVMRFLNKAYKA